MIASVDLAMGRVLDALERAQLLERTVVVFTSDNGGAVHFRATDNAPLRKGKGFAYEGGLRVPLIVRPPGSRGDGAARGRVVDAPVSGIDLFPTLAALAGVAAPHDLTLDGADLGPLLRGDGELGRAALTWHFPHYWWGTNVQPYSAIRRGDLKLIYRYESGTCELYDLANDVGEANDLVDERPELVREVRDELFRTLAAQGARMPEPNPEFGEGR